MNPRIEGIFDGFSVGQFLTSTRTRARAQQRGARLRNQSESQSNILRPEFGYAT